MYFCCFPLEKRLQKKKGQKHFRGSYCLQSVRTELSKTFSALASDQHRALRASAYDLSAASHYNMHTKKIKEKNCMLRTRLRQK